MKRTHVNQAEAAGFARAFGREAGSFLKSNQRPSFKGLEKCRSEICDAL
jgi:hypothetical protein